ncbi:MAG: tRNA guanosine(34) transglycosylase Tgt [Dehalococcoidia bacterium]|nr:tRNA guanosine(34) transglycosylase Tgt [Dehalococcoidia bacterium]
MTSPAFRLLATCPETGARAGELATPHGAVPTPVFAPVGSQGTVKTLTPADLKELKAALILANTYHLYLRPGIEVIARLGGLHRFMAWDGPILTDSGGYQLFSLATLSKVSDDGVLFRSHIDGSEHFLTPEKVIECQEKLGADIIMVLDQPLPYTEDIRQVQAAMERTQRWAERCRSSHHRADQAPSTGSGQALYGIVQGGTFPELRRQSAAGLTALDFPGYAIGGLGLGERKEQTLAIVAETVSYLPEDRPRYLMGIGSPEDVIEAIARGVDMFDCALPTRVARNGAFFTRDGRQNIRNAVYKDREAPLDSTCGCYTCRTFSAAYVHHLFKCEELLAYRLTTLHNLHFLLGLVREARDAIVNGTFPSFRKEFISSYRATSEEVRLEQKRRWLAVGRIRNAGS